MHIYIYTLPKEYNSSPIYTSVCALVKVFAMQTAGKNTFPEESVDKVPCKQATMLNMGCQLAMK